MGTYSPAAFRPDFEATDEAVAAGTVVTGAGEGDGAGAAVGAGTGATGVTGDAVVAMVAAVVVGPACTGPGPPGTVEPAWTGTGAPS